MAFRDRGKDCIRGIGSPIPNPRHWSTKGVASSAVVYSLLETAKAYGLDSHIYLIQLFEKLLYPDRVVTSSKK